MEGRVGKLTSFCFSCRLGAAVEAGKMFPMTDKIRSDVYYVGTYVRRVLSTYKVPRWIWICMHTLNKLGSVGALL